MSVLGAPLADVGMGFAQALIEAEVGGGDGRTGGEARAVDALIAGKRFRELGADLHQAATEIEGDVAARAGQTGGANEGPDFAAGRGNKFGELGSRDAAPDDSSRNRLGMGQFDFVGHG